MLPAYSCARVGTPGTTTLVRLALEPDDAAALEVPAALEVAGVAAALLPAGDEPEDELLPAGADA